MTDETLSRLATWLKDVEEDLPTKGPWIVEGPLFRTQKSDIYKATSRADGKTLALKYYFNQDAASQFFALQKTWKIFAEIEQFSAPRPWVMKESPETIIAMDWIDAPNLEDRILQLNFLDRTLDAPLTLAGQALDHIHRHGSFASDHLDTADFLNDIALASADLNQLPPQIQNSVDWLKTFASQASKPSLTTADLHGDYKPANILIEREGIYVIDGLFRGHGPILHDLAQFLNHLCLDLLRPQKLHQIFSLTEREAHFLKSTTTVTEAEISLPLSWLRVVKLVLMEIEILKQDNTPRTMYLKQVLRYERHRLMKAAEAQR